MARDVLVIDDDAELNELIGAYSSIAGFRYQGALNGQAALERARAQPFSLIVLDLMLPDMHGFEVCRRLKADPATASVPVIFLSALDSAEARQEGQRCGGATYLTKPFSPERLIGALQSYAAPP